MSKTIISFIPAYDQVQKAASSRIRVYYPNESVNKFYSDKFESSIGYNSKAHVLIVQKRIDNYSIQCLKEFQGLKIFDFDDPVYGHVGFRETIELCDVVTTDTEGRKQQFDSMNLGKPCVVIEDCLDYDINEPFPVLDSDKLVWFGNRENINSVGWILNEVASKNYNLDIISNSLGIQLPPQIKEIPWDFDTFVDNLRQSSICILSHAGENKDYKSNNKMLVALACGLPCIVNQSKSYEELANQFGLGKFIVNNPIQLHEAIQHLNNKENRELYLKDIQPYVINEFSSKKITLKLLNLINQIFE